MVGEEKEKEEGDKEGGKGPERDGIEGASAEICAKGELCMIPYVVCGLGTRLRVSRAEGRVIIYEDTLGDGIGTAPTRADNIVEKPTLYPLARLFRVLRLIML